MWIWAVFPCANWGCFNQHQCCLCVWTGQVGENGLCSSPMTKSIKSAFNVLVFLLFQNKYKIFQKFKCFKCSDFKGVFEIHIHQKSKEGPGGTPHPPVCNILHTDMKIVLHLIPGSFFCSFWPPSLAKYSGECFFLAWPHVLASLLPLLAPASWRTAFLPLSPEGQLHLAPTLRVYIQRGPATSTSWFHFQ